MVKLSEQEFQCQYLGSEGIVAGDISNSKSDAKKNLVFKLLRPLWESLKREIERARTQRRDTTALYDELEKLESQRNEEPARNEVEPHAYEESLLSDYKTEKPKPSNSINNNLNEVIEKTREVLSNLELMRDQIRPSGDAPPKAAAVAPTSDYQTGQNRSTEATIGEEIVPVSSVDSKYELFLKTLIFPKLLPVFVFFCVYIFNS